MKKISESAVRRLSLYLRLLQEADAAGAETISSGELADRGGTTSAQVRKDLSLFGSFGKRGLGYSVQELLSRIRSILGLQRTWRVALVGAGKLGSALFCYRDFETRGFDIRAVFDWTPARWARSGAGSPSWRTSRWRAPSATPRSTWPSWPCRRTPLSRWWTGW